MKIGALDNFWNKTAFENKLAVSEGTLGVGIQSYGEVKGEIIFTNEVPVIKEVEWDHIVEGSMNIKSGLLKVLNCPDCEVKLEINLPPDEYRIRVSGKNLDSVIDDHGDDFYRIDIWPQAYAEPELIKLHLRQ